MTNNIAESINGQMSNFFKKKPGKFECIDFLLFSEKRVVKCSQQLNKRTGEYDLDDYDEFIIKLQKKKDITYNTYVKFLKSHETPKGLKKNLRKDRR